MPKYQLYTVAELPSFEVLRGYVGRSDSVCISVAGSGGLFAFDPFDTTSADDGADTIVGNDGRRWKRITPSTDGLDAAIEEAQTIVDGIPAVMEPYVTAAEDAQAGAEAAQAAAEDARDAALLAGNVYDDTTAGLAATSSGDYFCVPSGEADESLILYLNDAGSADLVTSFPSADSLLVASFEQGVEGTLGTQTSSFGSGTIIMHDPVKRRGRAVITLKGGSAAGTVNIARYTRSGNTFTRVSALGSIALSIDTEAVFTTTDIIEPGEHLAFGFATGVLSGVTTDNTQRLPFSGYYGATGTTPPASATPTAGAYARVPQVRVEIREASYEAVVRDLLNGDVKRDSIVPAQYHSGSYFQYATGVSRPLRTMIYDKAADFSGRVRLTITGGVANGWVIARVYDKSGSTFTATGDSDQIVTTANTTTVHDLDLRVEAGQYLGLTQAVDSIAYDNQPTHSGVSRYLGVDVSGTGSEETNTNYFYTFDIIPDADFTRPGTIVFMGDSIIDSTTLEPIVPYVASLLKRPYVNAAIGGSTLSAAGQNSTNNRLKAFARISSTRLCQAIGSGDWTDIDDAAVDIAALPPPENPDITAQISALKALDYTQVRAIVIQHGTNDYGNSYDIGSASDTVDTTFRGAINKAVEAIHSAYPWLEIIFISPIYRHRFASNGDGNNSDIYANSLGNMMTDYVDALIDQTGRNHVAAMDAYRRIGINQWNANVAFADGLHLARFDSMFMWARRVAAFIEANSTLRWP